MYDDNFALVADLTLASANTSTMVNDVIVTKTAAYFTDSFQPQIYSVRRLRCSFAAVASLCACDVDVALIIARIWDKIQTPVFHVSACLLLFAKKE